MCLLLACTYTLRPLECMRVCPGCRGRHQAQRDLRCKRCVLKELEENLTNERVPDVIGHQPAKLQQSLMGKNRQAILLKIDGNHLLIASLTQGKKKQHFFSFILVRVSIHYSIWHAGKANYLLRNCS